MQRGRTAVTIMSKSTQYTFRPDGLPGRVVSFFQNNPDEELDLEAITEKFDATRGNIHTLLAKTVELAILVRTTNADGEYIYRAGKNLPRRSGVDMDAVHTPERAKAAPKGYQSPRKAVDISALQVDEDVPFDGTANHKGQAKWQPLFDKLTKPGQSIALPVDLRGAVGAAAAKINRAKTQGSFRVARTGADTCRVWRIA